MAKRAVSKSAETLAEFAARSTKLKEELPADIELLRQEIKSLRKRLRAGQGGAEIVVAAVQEVLGNSPLKLPPVPEPKRAKARGYEEIPCLHLSDLHFGKITKSFDSAVAAQRIAKLADKVCRITDIRRGEATVRECHVYLGGDIIEGELIFPGQAHLIDSPLVEQAVHNAPKALAAMLRQLLANFERVVVKCVKGNHGGNSRHAHPNTNWDLVACEVTKLLLSDQGKLHPRLAFDISDEFYVVDRVFEWGNLVVHGNQINGGFAGFPFYGVGKKAAGWADAIQEPWDYLYFGHFHTFTAGTLNSRQYFANGTLESDNEYALENMAASGHPSQRLTYYTADHGMIADMQLHLGGHRLSQAGRWKSWATTKR